MRPQPDTFFGDVKSICQECDFGGNPVFVDRDIIKKVGKTLPEALRGASVTRSGARCSISSSAAVMISRR